jgi:hypothetical protein
MTTNRSLIELFVALPATFIGYEIGWQVLALLVTFVRFWTSKGIVKCLAFSVCFGALVAMHLNERIDPSENEHFTHPISLIVSLVGLVFSFFKTKRKEPEHWVFYVIFFVPVYSLTVWLLFRLKYA